MIHGKMRPGYTGQAIRDAIAAEAKREIITGPDATCAYAGCPKPWRISRIGASGYRIGYCSEHAGAAGRIFDGGAS